VIVKKFIRLNWVIIVILVFAVVLRFWRLEELTTFGGDQGYDFLVVKKILEGDLTLLGPKIGPYNKIGNLYLGPAYYYLLAPFLFIFREDPIGGAVLTALLSIFAIFVIYELSRKFFSKEVGFIASLIYAFNSFLINQSRAPSNPHLIPFFSILTTYSVLMIIIKNSKSILWPICAGLSLGIIFQLHYLASSLLIVSLLFLVLAKKFKSALYTIVSFIVLISPQILFELRNQFFISSLVIKQLEYGQEISKQDIFLKSIFDSTKSLYSTLIFSNFILIAVSLIFALIAIGILIKKNNKLAPLFLFLPIPLNIIFASLYSAGQPLHYFSTIYPNVAILAGLIFITVYSKRAKTPAFKQRRSWNPRSEGRENHSLQAVGIYKKYKKSIFVRAIIVMFLLIYLILNLSNLKLSRKEGYTMPNGWNLTGMKSASHIIANDASPNDKFNIAATLDGDTRAMPYRYLVEVYGKHPFGVEKYPQADSIYLISRDSQEQIDKYSVWEISSFKPFEISRRWEIQNGIKLYKLVKAQKES